MCLHHVEFPVCVMLISMLICAQCAAQHSHMLQGGGGECSACVCIMLNSLSASC